MAYDFGGRMTSRTDQLGRATAFAYDQRSLLRTRTTGTNLDTFDYDALGRMRLADRGITGSSAATSHATYGYNDLGDLTGESLQIADGTARITSYGYDQAGNRTSLTYPGSVAVGYTPTAINQVDAMTLTPTSGGSEVDLVEYEYNGRMLDSRLTQTLAPGTHNVYEYKPGFDTHRRITSVGNTLALNGAPAQTVAGYTFTRDRASNPRSQTATGRPEFAGDNRALTPDRLDRLISTAFTRGGTETTALDLQGNRESHIGRDGTTTDYALKYGTSPATTANEYATVDPDGPGGNLPILVTYDAVGNLVVDEAGRHYEYDEQNRLTEIRASDGTTVLADYAYDALGRRISAVFDPGTPGERNNRYYYDGRSVIEERDGSQAGEPRLRYHVHGGQYIDEHVATYTDPGGSRSGGFSYYLHNDLYTAAGLGDDAGSIVEAYDYEAYGRPTTVGGSVTCTRGDVNGDGSVDGDDIPLFLAVLFGDDSDPVHICASDIDGDGDVDDADSDLLANCLWWGTCEHVCVGGDLDGNGTVEFADLPQFIGVLLEGPASAQEACASDLTGPGGVRDGVADDHDIQAFISCLLGADCPPPPGGTIPDSGGSGGPPSSTFFLHGAIVSALLRVPAHQSMKFQTGRGICAGDQRRWVVSSSCARPRTGSAPPPPCSGPERRHPALRATGCGQNDPCRPAVPTG
jgi:YD repeat-containing protein